MAHPLAQNDNRHPGHRHVGAVGLPHVVNRADAVTTTQGGERPPLELLEAGEHVVDGLIPVGKRAGRQFGPKCRQATQFVEDEGPIDIDFDAIWGDL